LQVNSLHGQAIDRLAPGLRVEALAPDGTVEAVHISAHPGFALAVQWHPEWKVLQNPASHLLFRAFGDAAARRWRAGSAGRAGRPVTRCLISIMALRADFTQSDLERFFDENQVDEVECLVPDLTGVARGKILRAPKFTQDRGMRLPSRSLR